MEITENYSPTVYKQEVEEPIDKWDTERSGKLKSIKKEKTIINFT